MNGMRKRHRFGLRTKLNIVLTVCILLVSLGLVRTTYTVYSRKVDSFYLEQAGRASRAVARYYIFDDYVSYLRRSIDNDAFREVRERAAAANDEEILKEWMQRQPPSPVYQTLLEDYGDKLGEEQKASYNLYADYRMLCDSVAAAKTDFMIKCAYIQYVADGVTYNLLDPDERLLVIGTAEAPIEALAEYTGNDRIPPTVYRFGDDWLCTACEPIMEEVNGEKVAVGQACVDIDMNDVIRERHWFLVNSILFIAALTLAAIAASMLLTRKLATEPLSHLAEGATGFGRGDGGFSREDVISLPIRSNDEIGDLYREIRSMQERIVDNADQLTSITAERERVNTELHMAAKIQSSALPKQFPAFPGRPEFDLYACMAPAKEVGGDFYDFFLVDDDHLALVIADVSDKGVPAALFMMSAKNLISYRAQMGGSPREILEAVNVQLCEDNRLKMFVTVWLGILEISTGRLACANAGHEYPFVRSGGGAFRLLRDKHGLVAGAMPQAKYTDYTLVLSPGDALFVYTDGVTEANNTAGEMYGMDRLEKALSRVSSQTPKEILQHVRADVDAFANGAEPSDDLTMLCLQYRGPGRGDKEPS